MCTGSRVCRANELGWPPCWLVCSEEPSSTAGGDGYTGRGETTSGNICIYGDPHEPSSPSCEGRNIGQAKGGVSGGIGVGTVPADAHARSSNLRPAVLMQNQTGAESLGQMKVMTAIERCRTAALGGHVARCDNNACGHTIVAYNFCLMGKLGNGESDRINSDAIELSSNFHSPLRALPQ